jgi:hypothetical protein
VTVQRTKALANLPGRQCDPLGKEIPKAIMRMQDWKADQILKYPNADWVVMGETVPALCAASPMAIEFILKHSFDNVTKFDEKTDCKFDKLLLSCTNPAMLFAGLTI